LVIDGDGKGCKGFLIWIDRGRGSKGIVGERNTFDEDRRKDAVYLQKCCATIRFCEIDVLLKGGVFVACVY
jgi:hypothetical protein